MTASRHRRWNDSPTASSPSRRNSGPIRDRDDLEPAATALLASGARSVFLKGGHVPGDPVRDLYLGPDGAASIEHARIAVEGHGTGCTLSSAIAAGLAKGLDLFAAVAEGKAYVTAAIVAADRLEIGKGHGPVHHFHAWW